MRLEPIDQSLGSILACEREVGPVHTLRYWAAYLTLARIPGPTRLVSHHNVVHVMVANDLSYRLSQDEIPNFHRGMKDMRGF